MRDKRRATWLATLLAAFATAHLMQFGLTAGQTFRGLVEGAAAPPRTVADAPVLPVSPAPVAWPASAVAGPRTPADPALPARLGRGTEGPLGLDCTRGLAATPEPGAMLRVVLSAPCDPGVRVEFAHAGLSFALPVSPQGRVEVRVPALTAEAEVTAALDDGSEFVARADVPEVRGILRVAVSAAGRAAPSLRAPGAPPPRAAAIVLAAQGPVAADPVLRLGDPGIAAPRLAQVYTAPETGRRFIAPEMPRIEVEVTAANCGEDMALSVVRSDGLRAPEVTQVDLAMPDCAAVGDLLLLPPGADPLRLARN